jgi:hypothetical protein
MILKKLFLGGSLGVGILFLGVALSIFLQRDPSPQDRDAAWGCILIGISPTAVSGLLIWDLYQGRQRVQQNRSLVLEAIFLQQIQANRGNITVESLAIASKLPMTDAQKYLEEKSRQLHGTFETDETGRTFYHFDP